MTLFIAFLIGVVFTVIVNRMRWSIFPMSGGPTILSAMGQPPDFDPRTDLMTQPCPKCGRPPFNASPQ